MATPNVSVGTAAKKGFRSAGSRRARGDRRVVRHALADAQGTAGMEGPDPGLAGASRYELQVNLADGGPDGVA